MCRRRSCDPRGASRHDAGDCVRRTGFSSRPMHSERSPLHDVRNHARRIRGERRKLLPDEPMAVRILPTGGARRDRTDDLLLAKQALSQLSYGPLFSGKLKSANPKSDCDGWPASRSSRQPAQASPFGLCRAVFTRFERRLVGLGRFELPTSRLSSARSNQLSYKPEPGVSGQKPAIRGRFVASDCRILITDSWSARSRRKRNGDGGVLQIEIGRAHV